MKVPEIASKKPTVSVLETGDYYWCACGQSKKQPYCDGSHQGTEFTPLAFSIEKEKKVALCNCKHTSNPPFCDGAHKSL
jgi:CDGSH-type Zn-finger protein